MSGGQLASLRALCSVATPLLRGGADDHSTTRRTSVSLCGMRLPRKRRGLKPALCCCCCCCCCCPPRRKALEKSMHHDCAASSCVKVRDGRIGDMARPAAHIRRRWVLGRRSQYQASPLDVLKLSHSTHVANEGGQVHDKPRDVPEVNQQAERGSPGVLQLLHTALSSSRKALPLIAHARKCELAESTGVRGGERDRRWRCLERRRGDRSSHRLPTLHELGDRNVCRHVFPYAFSVQQVWSRSLRLAPQHRRVAAAWPDVARQGTRCRQSRSKAAASCRRWRSCIQPPRSRRAGSAAGRAAPSCCPAA